MIHTGAAKQWQVTCFCVWRARGTRDEVVSAVQQHGRSAHQLDVTAEQAVGKMTPAL